MCIYIYIYIYTYGLLLVGGQHHGVEARRPAVELLVLGATASTSGIYYNLESTIIGNSTSHYMRNLLGWLRLGWLEIAQSRCSKFSYLKIA